MSKSIAELTNSKNIGNSETVLADIFKSFQNFDDLIKSNKDLKEENSELREETKDLFNRIIKLEATVSECRLVEYELQNKIEKCLIEKQ